METKRLKRIKPQFVPRRLLWRRKLSLPPRPQNPEEEVAALLAQFARASRFRQPVLSRWAVSTLSVAPVVVLACAVLPGLSLSVAQCIVIWLALQLIVLLSLRCVTASDRLLCLARQLSGSDDVRAIPALTSALYWPDAGTRTASAYALIRLLPRLGPGDAGLLDARTRARLRRHLGRPATRHRHELTLAILLAMQRVGDERDLRAIAALAHRPAHGMAEQRVQQAASACLTCITARSAPQGGGEFPVPLADAAAETQAPDHSSPLQTNTLEEKQLPLGAAHNS